GPIGETVELFRQLKEKGKYKFYALTNWSAELFPIALQKYDFLHWFDGIVVSGEEKIRKPFPRIYQLLLERYSVKASDVLFIDDNLRNINAAEALGIESHHFKNAAGLEEELNKKSLL
ncbi:MAG TPA: HAD-IA family hydrolase, partial [Chitinophagaceae bacterium]|nr:HAD-IA family hydrolase [Chitinophagaceae bacterium]